MLIRALALLICLQSVILFAQPGPGHISLPQKSKDCTPAEEKWWNDIRHNGDEISSLREQLNEVSRQRGNTKKVTNQLEARRNDLIALIKTGHDKKYNAPVDDTRIMILYSPRPQYSEEARQQKVQGTVQVEAEFQADGQIGKARVLRGIGHGLDEKALDAVRTVTFVPQIAGGHFMASTHKIVVSFSLF